MHIDIKKHRELIIVLVVILTLGGIGYGFWRRTINNTVTQTPTSTPAPVTKVVEAPPEEIRWQETSEGGWRPSGTPPACTRPLLPMSPVITAEASEILYPGQYRGTHFKAHGGFRFASKERARTNKVEVKLPIDAKLTGLTRYLQDGEIQYLMTFVNDCGLMIRFDHLLTLSPELAKIAATTPEPKPDDTRGLPLKVQPSFKAGTMVAIEVGAKKNNNVGFDFGLYDLRQRNKISQNSKWADLHKNEAQQTFYGICWLDELPAADTARVKQILPLATDDRGASDYCTFAAGGSTLDYNNGLPVISHSRPNVSRN